MVTKQRQWCGIGHGFVALDISLAQISNVRSRCNFRGCHGSGLAAVHVRVDRQIIVGLQARQVRVANASVTKQMYIFETTVIFYFEMARCTYVFFMK